MYCPNCGMQTAESATFCRGCGSNLSLVSQALSGNLVPASTAPGDSSEPKHPKSMVDAITKISSGLGFVAAAIFTLYFAPAGSLWWYWLLIPAFGSIGAGIATIAQVKMNQRSAGALQSPGASAKNTVELSEGERYAVAPPPSIVDVSTSQLDRSRENSR
ncbi:MAG: zinc-ribbon domain-containing protein [Blastocatellia bacterium]